MATFTVTTTNPDFDPNDNRTSLIEAIQLAAAHDGADVIRFAQGIGTVSVGDSYPFLIEASGGALTIDGDSNGDGIADVAIDAGRYSRHFAVQEGAELTLTNIALINGFQDLSGLTPTPGGIPAGMGHDAYSSIMNYGELTLAYVTFENNVALAGDGAAGVNGPSGWDGTAGGHGQNASLTSGSTAGGDGTNGVNGGNAFNGGAGGNAATVINYGLVNWIDSEFGDGNTATAGDGGNGGRGGDGGDGGAGGEGGDGHFPTWVTSAGGDGGDGGDGGNGGFGGHGGIASSGILNLGSIVAGPALVDSNPYGDDVTGGAGGSAGAGGSGGAAGSGGRGGQYIGLRGESGEDGASGYSGLTRLPGAVGDAFTGIANGGTIAVETASVYVRTLTETVGEGDTVTFLIQRNGDSDGDITVDWSMDRMGTLRRKDFVEGTEFSGQVQFAAGGPDSIALTFETRSDGKAEGAESFAITLDGATVTGGTRDVPLGTASVEATILSNFANGRSPGADELLLGTGKADKIKGFGGDDIIRGRKGDDKLLGGKGDDKIKGAKGDDTVKGGSGEDILLGNQGDDRLKGGRDQDVLVGGKGDDKVTGGRGDDIFVFNAKSGDDVVTDFSAGEDLIRFSTGTASFDDLDLRQDGEHTILTHEGGTVKLRNVEADSLTADDFLF